MVLPTNQEIWLGNPPSPDHEPDRAQIIEKMDFIQAHSGYDLRDATSAALLAAQPAGSIVTMGGVQFATDPAATGSASATSDLAVDGLVPHGHVTPQHFGCPTDGVSDCQPATQRMADWLAAQTAGVSVKFPPGKYVFNSGVGFDNPKRSFMDLRGAQFEWGFDGALFDMNKAVTAALPVTSTADTYTKKDQYVYGGDFKYTGATRTVSAAIQAYFMRGFFWTDFYVEGAFSVCRFGGKDTYRFENFRAYDCIRYFEIPDEGVLYAGTLTGNDTIDAVINGHIAGPTTAEWGVYAGARTMGLRVNGSISGNFTAGHVKVTDGSVTATRATVIGFRSEQIESGRVAVDFDASRGTGFLNVSIQDGTEISGLNGWFGINFAKCAGVTIGNCVFVDGSGAAVGTERAIYIDDACRDVRIDTETTLFTGIAAGREIVLQSAAARENITLLPEMQWMDSPLTVTGYNGVGAIPTKSELLDIAANITLPANRIPLLPPKAWKLTAQFKENTGAGDPAIFTNRLRIAQANEAGTAAQSTSEGILIETGGLPNLYRASADTIVRANDNGDLWIDVLTNADNGTIVLQVSGYCQ
ncbi:hypothetical protein [Profundibacter sp.]